MPIIYDFEFSEEHVALDGQILIFSGNGSYLQLIRLCDIKASKEKTCLGDEYVISFLDYDNVVPAYAGVIPYLPPECQHV